MVTDTSGLAYEHVRDGVRVDGLRVDGPFIGAKQWYVVLRVDGRSERRMAYDLYLKRVASDEHALTWLAASSAERRRARMNRAWRTWYHEQRRGLQAWLEGRAAHNHSSLRVDR